jgi:RimJ/RimL family protein N-acetyltransferase
LAGMEPVEISAGRLSLRPWQPEDAAALLTAFTDPETRRWTSRPVPYLPEHARAYVERVSPDGWRSGKDLGFAVCESASGSVLGGVSLRAGCDEGVRDVGYWTMPAARGTHVASDALRTVSRWAFATLDVARLEWMAEVGNWASRRVAERAGFTIEGALRSGLLHRDQHVDGWIGARLPDDPDRDTGAFPSYAGVSDGVVALRRWRESDAADVARACSDAETARWLPVPVPYGEVDGLAYVAGIVPTEWFAGTVSTSPWWTPPRGRCSARSGSRCGAGSVRSATGRRRGPAGAVSPPGRRCCTRVGGSRRSGCRGWSCWPRSATSPRSGSPRRPGSCARGCCAPYAPHRGTRARARTWSSTRCSPDPCVRLTGGPGPQLAGRKGERGGAQVISSSFSRTA